MPDAAACPAWTHRHQVGPCPGVSFRALLCRVGDLEEGPLEAAQSHRFATFGELAALRATYAAGSRPRRSTQCDAIPEPSWSVDNRSLYFSDATSRFALRTPVDMVNLAPASGNAFDELERHWASRQRLRDRWIYMLGDSTMRQLFGHLVDVLRQRGPEGQAAISFEQLKSMARSEADFNVSGVRQCPTLHQPAGWDYRYPGPSFGKNEKTTTLHLPDRNLTLTFDWKMHIFRRYDRWLLKRRFASAAPDVLIVSPGLHDCAWNESNALGPEYHALQARTLVSLLTALLPPSTELVWMSAQVGLRPYSNGRLPPHDSLSARLARASQFTVQGTAHLRCIQALNRVGAEAGATGTGQLTFVDRERVTRDIAHLAVHGRGRSRHNDGEATASWQPPDTAEERSLLLTSDGTHYQSNVIRVLGHYLRSALGCVMRSEPRQLQS